MSKGAKKPVIETLEQKVAKMPDGPTKQAMLRDIEVKKAKSVTK